SIVNVMNHFRGEIVPSLFPPQDQYGNRIWNDETATRTTYFTMERCEGTLANWMKNLEHPLHEAAAAAADGEASIAEAEKVVLFIVYHLLVALQHFSEKQLTHFDLKTDNVLFLRRRQRRVTPAEENSVDLKKRES